MTAVMSNTQKKKMQRNYTRAGIVSLEEVLPLIRDPAIKSVVLHGQKVNVTSLRLQNFAKSTVCVSCGLQATHFAVETNSDWHLNLYATREGKSEMLFTHDHTLARSLGGSDDASNTTTMCAKCNSRRQTLGAMVVAYFYFDVDLKDVLVAAAVYLVAGVIWSFIRYRAFVAERVEFIKTSVAEKYRHDRALALAPSNNLDRITGWIIIWPFSFVEHVLGDIITAIKSLVTKVFKGVYHRIYTKLTAGLLDLPVEKPADAEVK